MLGCVHCVVLYVLNMVNIGHNYYAAVLYSYSIFQVSFVSNRFDVCYDRLTNLVCYILQ